MLCISRRSQQRLVLIHPDGTEVWLRVGQIGHDRVALLIDAPAAVRVKREELLERERREAKEGT